MKNDSILNILFPTGIKCVLCDAELDTTAGDFLCENCRLPFNDRYCIRCGRALSTDTKYCLECQNNPSAVDLAIAPCIFEDGAKTMVHALKFGNSRHLVPYMARLMADRFKQAEIKADFITFVPMHRRKQKQRGYNQAQLLAIEVGKLLGLPCIDILDKTRYFKNTAKLKRYQRKEAVLNSVEIAHGVNFAGKTAVLIDDVYTTGTTAAECAKRLKESGVDKVNVLTFATSRVLIYP